MVSYMKIFTIPATRAKITLRPPRALSERDNNRKMFARIEELIFERYRLDTNTTREKFFYKSVKFCDLNCVTSVFAMISLSHPPVGQAWDKNGTALRI
jgi:hypothetical protein